MSKSIHALKVFFLIAMFSAVTGCVTLQKLGSEIKEATTVVGGSMVTSLTGGHYQPSAPKETEGALREYNWYQMFLATLKKKPNFDYSSADDDFMRLFWPADYGTYKNDEFEYEGRRQKANSETKEDVENLDPNQEYSVFTDLDFGKYDFEKGLFPIQDLSRAYFEAKINEINLDQAGYGMPNAKYAYAQMRADNGYKFLGIEHFPKRYVLRFSNPEVLGGLVMKPDAARDLVNHLKKKKFASVAVERLVNAQIVFKLKEQREADPSQLVGEIERIIIWDYPRHQFETEYSRVLAAYYPNGKVKIPNEEGLLVLQPTIHAPLVN